MLGFEPLLDFLGNEFPSLFDSYPSVPSIGFGYLVLGIYNFLSGCSPSWLLRLGHGCLRFAGSFLSDTCTEYNFVLALGAGRPKVERYS